MDSLWHSLVSELKKDLPEQQYDTWLKPLRAERLAIYISWLMHGIRGALVAGILFFLPAFFLLSVLAAIYLSYGDVPLVQGIFYGIKPAVVAVVLFAAWRIGARALKNGLLWGISALAFIGIFFFKIDFPWIVLVAGILGATGGKLFPAKFKSGGGHGASGKTYGAALIDDHTPPPAHAVFSWKKFTLMTGAFVFIWAAVMWLLSGQPALFEMGEFFTQAAFLTIGGAYAVLPYVYQGGVEQFHWLTGAQMMDGLALGETTPGPLIMVRSAEGKPLKIAAPGKGSIQDVMLQYALKDSNITYKETS